MSSLVLDSLEIKNFRAFRHLQINQLGRVNLVVGRNNIGKSCLLEALSLYARRGNPAVIRETLKTRDENIDAISRDPGQMEGRADAIKHLFHGRRAINNRIDPIQIRSLGRSQDELLITVYWPNVHSDDALTASLKPEEYDTDYMVPGLTIQTGTRVRAIYPLDGMSLVRWQIKPFEEGANEIPCVFIAAGTMSNKQSTGLWDNIALTASERDVLTALRIIAPDVEAINFVGSLEATNQRVPMVRISGHDSPIPLRSLGEGMSRMFGISLALVNAKDGLLLIDEVDTGIHYSILPSLWRLIFEVAHRLNVQVFATSHSWDCIQAFQQAADENKQEEGILIRLQNKNGDVSPVLFDEEELNVVAREMIEVR